MKDNDRLGHIYCIGKTGVGKSTLLLSMAIADIQNGKGLCVIDPHGDIAESILNYVPPERIHDVIYFNPKDPLYAIGYNPLKGIDPMYHHLVASGLISTFKKVWIDSWGPRLEYILRFALLTLLEYPEATLLDVQPLLTNPYFRNKVLNHVTNHHTHSFWKHEFDKYTPALRAEAIAPILNKTGSFLTSLPLRDTVGQKKSSFNMQQVMDEGKIFIANISKGELGEDTASILGSMLVTAIQLAALFRSTQKESDRVPFYLYVDEMHTFISLSFADILSEARKYKLSLFLTHQYIGQLHEKVRSAIFGNVGTIISFRIGAEDAEYLAREFFPIFNEADLVTPPRFSMYLKLMIDGATSQPFSAQTNAVTQKKENHRDIIYELSNKKYGTLKTIIEEEINAKTYTMEQSKVLTLFE